MPAELKVKKSIERYCVASRDILKAKNKFKQCLKE